MLNNKLHLETKKFIQKKRPKIYYINIEYF